MDDNVITNITERLGERLIRLGLIDDQMLRVALAEQQSVARRLGEILVDFQFITPHQLSQVLGASAGYPSLSLAQMIPDAQALALMPQHLARQLRVLPFAWDVQTHTLSLVAADPDHLLMMDRVRQQLPRRDTHLSLYIAPEKDILSAIDHSYGYDLSIEGILHLLESGQAPAQVLSLASLTQVDASYVHPVVRLVDALLFEAVRQGASDIHVEPEKGYVRLSYRVDGVLRDIRLLHQRIWPAILVRFKLMAGMDIAESRLPQDGQLSSNIAGHWVDFRASTMPVTQGESLVLRVLDKDKQALSLADLSLSAVALQQIHRLLAQAQGMILVCGPTGSGKTTSLYAMLAALQHQGLNMVTLEDPVEYHIPRVRQTQIREDIGLDFATGLRALLRQDPDVMLIGEIRDEATAQMALRAAMTGHRVFATLHANHNDTALTRLIEMGIARTFLTGSLTGIISQRLLRKLCGCHQSHPPTSEQQQAFRAYFPQQPMPEQLAVASGCEKCAMTGYRGRAAVMEIWRVNAAFESLLSRPNHTRHDWRMLAQEQVAAGEWTSMMQSAYHLIATQVTSLEEVMRQLASNSDVD
jgi:type II secretory ATPase GspE/PulE/Tfp pilus assembly ATPase PilB-like protein